LGLLVVVPLALGVHPSVSSRWVVVAVVAAAVPAVASLVIGRSLVAALLAAPWLIFTGVLAATAAWGWLRAHPRLVDIPAVASLAYLAVGAAWLVLDRADVEPVGVTAPFVQLTAVHFTYAGFGATLLAALVHARARGHAPRAAAAMVAAVMLSPPIVAAGFTFAGPLQVVGAVALTAGLFTLAALTLRQVVPEAADGVAKVLLVVSSVAVFVPMLLAVQWAVGANYGTPALSIPAMAQTHGAINALGFTLCGVMGWRRLRAEPGALPEA
jgi:hypothetical protein